MVFQFAAVSDIHILRGLEFHLGTLKGCQLPMVPLSNPDRLGQGFSLDDDHETNVMSFVSLKIHY